MKTKIEQKLDREFENMGVKPSIYHIRQDVLPFAGVTVVMANSKYDYSVVKLTVQSAIRPYQYGCAGSLKTDSERLGIPGIAICDHRDQYNNRLGRTIAKGRLLKALKKKNAD